VGTGGRSNSLLRSFLSTVGMGRGLKLSLEELKLLEVGVAEGVCG
jgi:hypothetical protein